MRKRVLIAEPSDAIRGVAENILRQNGFEVISVSSTDKALEVMELARPDLFLVDAELKTKSQTPLYERLASETRSASIPILIFADPDNKDIPFPEEVIIRKPFDPGEFLERVKVFTGPVLEKQEKVVSNPLDNASLEDDFIDAALGTDNIKITNSEVMDKTTMTGKLRVNAGKAEHIGLDVDHSSNDESSRTNRVESLVISDDDSDIRAGSKGKPAIDIPSGTGKLDIISGAEALHNHQALTNDSHDYDWFVSSIKQDDKESEAGGSPTDSASAKPAIETEELSITPTSEVLEPMATRAMVTKPESHSGNVEKFIDEFKKEVEQFRSEKSESSPVSDQAVAAKAELESGLSEETIKKLSTEIAGNLAEKIAQKIVDKLGSDKLLKLVREELLDRAAKK